MCQGEHIFSPITDADLSMWLTQQKYLITFQQQNYVVSFSKR